MHAVIIPHTSASLECALRPLLGPISATAAAPHVHSSGRHATVTMPHEHYPRRMTGCDFDGVAALHALRNAQLHTTATWLAYAIR